MYDYCGISALGGPFSRLNGYMKFNIYRVLVGADVKLATLNNRIYFSFYSSMLAGCVLYLRIGFFLKKKVKAVIP